jgi:Caspase domain
MLGRIIVVALLLGWVSSAAHAAMRVALVIGNSAYKHARKLSNPRNDAADTSAALSQRGFRVIDGFDLDKAVFDRKVRDFGAALSGADVGLFFYAGHGLQVSGQNYLVPVDAEPFTASSIDWEMVRLDLVQRTMEREASANIIFLHACRDNPLDRNQARAMGTRSAEIGHGLAASEAGIGILNSFSTQPGNVALDTSSIAAFELFIAGYKATYHAGLAQLRIEGLKEQQESGSPEAIPRPAPSSPADASRNPFGVEDVGDPYGEDVRQFAKVIQLPGGSGDRNAAQWSPSVTTGRPGTLDGEWFGRWEFGSAGTGRIQVVGNRLYALYTDQAGRMTGKTWILEAVIERRDRLVGRWMQVGRPSDTGPFVGLIVGEDRIDGIWNWGGTGRWDFRRKLMP